MPLINEFDVFSGLRREENGKIISEYNYTHTVVDTSGPKPKLVPLSTKYTFKVDMHVPKLGVMIVGLGGNNGSTVVASCIANKEKITWETKNGVEVANYYGSLTQASTVRVGQNERGEDVYVPMNRLLPMVDPNDIVWGGWDINSADMAEAMARAKVLDYDLQKKLKPKLQGMVPLPSVYEPDYIAQNQSDRADNLLQAKGKWDVVEELRKNIRDFKSSSGVDKVIVIWSANTERYSEVISGLNDTAEALLSSIKKNESEIAPSILFAVASILEGVSYINGSPQNTFVPGVIDLAEKNHVFIGGNDFKSGQTKLKSVLVDFLVGAGIKPVSIVSYNHLGNNDGKNLSQEEQFRSKEISKSSVIDDMVESNGILYGPNEHPDHVIIIKYVPAVGDSKRAMDEYVSKIFMGGTNTIALHNTCEDSLLAAPLIIDLVVLTELMERITYKTADMETFEHFHPVLSILSYLFKAPSVPHGVPVVNSLPRQRSAIENFLRICAGIPVESSLDLEHRTGKIVSNPLCLKN
ncbi:uncharacterized protein LOC126324058 [Schistocerca gregaria]|uniref:uncharacterized protein LOC126324058 n=1 Tax=Schistocerca gregaria TaxID=7010 RepID=UPI00211DD522|nr:uncharacterized protein LOC126324058 [Schistocerca gregaria]